MRGEPNTRLAELFASTGWSKGELARLVNRRAAAMGCPTLSTDTSRVRRWLEDGERPRDPVPRVLSVLFTERLGRVVTSEDLGFTGSARQRGRPVPDRLPWPTERTVTALTEYTGMDLMLNRRGFTGTGFSLAAGPILAADFESWLNPPDQPDQPDQLAPGVGKHGSGHEEARIPAQGGSAAHLVVGARNTTPAAVGTTPAAFSTPSATLSPTLGTAAVHTGGGPGFGTTHGAAVRERLVERPLRLPGGDYGPLGEEEIDALEQAVTVFRVWDAEHGGGLQRKAVVGQLNEVGNLLVHGGPPALAARLWSVAADLAALAGWMSHDVALDATAQNYFVIAAHAAREAGDLPRAAEALSRAARQLVHLDKPADALALVGLAQRTLGEDATGTLPALLHAVHAWALAALGQVDECRRALAAAQREFDMSATGTSGTDTAAHRDPPADEAAPTRFDRADLHGMQALTYRELARTGAQPGAAGEARRHAEAALRLRGSGQARARTLDMITLASACLLDGRPEEGAAHATRAVTAAGQICSHRAWHRLSELRELAGHYPEVTVLQQLWERVPGPAASALPSPRPAGPKAAESGAAGAGPLPGRIPAPGTDSTPVPPQATA